MSIATVSEIRSWLGISTTFTADDTFVLTILSAAIDRLFADFLGYSISQATRTEYYPPRVNLNQRDGLVDGYERSGSGKVIPMDRYRNERRIIQLRHLPVRSITAVAENPDAWLSDPPDFDSQYLLTSGSDYMLDQQTDGLSTTGFLVRNTGPWSSAERCVRVTYVGGYDSGELGDLYSQLKYAFLTQVQVSYNAVRIHRIGGISQLGGMPGILASESLGDWSASYDTATNAKLYGLQNKLAPSVQQVLEPYINYSAFVF